MKVKAYVLIEARVGKTRQVIEAIRGFKGVSSVESVTGPYDAIAVLTTKTTTEINDLIVAMVQPTDCISRTVTCIAV